MQTISSHSSASSCWLLINKSVYDATGYLSSHPAGPGSIVSLCGQDASSAYNAISSHSQTLSKVKLLGQVCTSSVHRGEEAHIDTVDEDEDEDSVNVADEAEFHGKAKKKHQKKHQKQPEEENPEEKQEHERVRDVEFELAEVRKLSRTLQKLRVLIERNEY